MVDRVANLTLDTSRLDRVPPHNIEAEESLLGAMMISKDAVLTASEIVDMDDFYRDFNREVYRAITNLYSQGEPVDPVTVAEELKKMGFLEKVGGKVFIHSLVSNVPIAANAKYYATIVNNNALLRRLINAATRIATMGYEVPSDIESTIDKAEQLIFDVSKQRHKSKLSSLKELLAETFEQIEKLYDSKSYLTGLPTGYIEFDKKTAGLQPSDLIVVAARPAIGKTSFTLGIAQHVALVEKKAVAIFSLEMSKQQLTQRLMCSEARIDASRLRSGTLRDEDWPKLSRAVGRLAEAQIFIDDTASITLLELRAKIRRLMARQELSLIIVDYLQLMQAGLNYENRQQEISDISRSLKILGRELNIPVIAVSQLSRAVEQRSNKRPMLADLRESGAIEQDADLVVFIYRDEVYNEDTEDRGIAEVIIGKHRNGPTGMVKMAFLEQYTKFTNLAQIE
ncbi:replicative DNA helicase [Candidatus Hakubella thermalkaliphila]|uniref:Replicative DNA helicase n=4 Tax=Candidatus Hakubella thermalkaliphila TaxID=2754717 RepID=A0A6V8PUH8_9ACTN|nr:replicative DNA helicase [Candidatus Hakubella thermalkaliphila]GFP22024.1 replicative DNA helicase [Candidatus Hakubella thermalkaliphila]GFP34371.1 replicative DNA helicase [Candidatus Hakubella thermalkaliphila]